jgi:hypothetical protein
VSTTEFVLRKHYQGWQLRWAVVPVINGWPQEPLQLFDGRTAARRHLDHLTAQPEEG